MKKNFPICTKPWTSLEVRRTDGGVKCCCWLKLYLGNVKANSVYDVWNNENYKFIREKMLKGDIDEICNPDCQVLNVPKNSLIIQKHQTYPVIDFNQTEFIKNRKLSIKEIMEGRTVLSSLPSRIMLHPSDRCNLRCVMCGQVDKEKKANPNERIYKEVESLYPLLEELKFVGGEPMLCEVTKNIIYNFASDRFPNCRISFVTNGTFLTKRNIDRLSKINIGWIEISLDAATAATYESIRVGARWSNTIAGIENLLYSSNENEKHFPIYLSMVVQKSNYNEIPAFVELGCRLGTNLVFLWVHNTEELINYEAYLEEPILKGLEKAYQFGDVSAIIALTRLIENKPAYFKQFKPEKNLKYYLRMIDNNLFNSRLSDFYHKSRNIDQKLNYHS